MKFKLFIEPSKAEIVEAYVHQRSDFSAQLKEFFYQMAIQIQL